MAGRQALNLEFFVRIEAWELMADLLIFGIFYGGIALFLGGFLTDVFGER